MNGEENNAGRTNFWYSFDFGLAHFISLDGETDFAYSPEWPFVRDLSGNETLPKENETFSTDSGPFGYINGSWKDNKAYEQYQWLAKDLAGIDRQKTPWVFAMSHRPMYSSEVSSYQKNVRNAWEELMLEHGVDAYFAGHVSCSLERIGDDTSMLTMVLADSLVRASLPARKWHRRPLFHQGQQHLPHEPGYFDDPHRQRRRR